MRMKKREGLCLLILLLVCFGCMEEKAPQKKKGEKKIVVARKSVAQSKWDSLTPEQQSVLRKTLESYKGDTTEDLGTSPYFPRDILTPEEYDAEMELNVRYYNLRKLHISESQFCKRFKEIFGYDDVADMDDQLLLRRLSKNTVIVDLPDVYDYDFYLSQSSRVVISTVMMHISFSDYESVFSYEYESVGKSDSIISIIGENAVKFSSIDWFYHCNNYLFNDGASSRAWLLAYNKYFMYHLIMTFGYDGDSELNRNFLWDYLQGVRNLFDKPFSVVHFYPDGRYKIRNGLLKQMTELLVQGNSLCYLWAEDELERYCLTDKQKSKNQKNKEGDDLYIPPDKMQLDSAIGALPFEKRCEVIALIANAIYPVFLENSDGNCEYSDVWLQSCNINIPTSFWNAINKEHNLLSEIDRNNCYGLPYLQELMSVIRNDRRFYDEEGNLAPWKFDLSAGLKSMSTE